MLCVLIVHHSTIDKMFAWTEKNYSEKQLIYTNQIEEIYLFYL